MTRARNLRLEGSYTPELAASCKDFLVTRACKDYFPDGYFASLYTIDLLVANELHRELFPFSIVINKMALECNVTDFTHIPEVLLEDWGDDDNPEYHCPQHFSKELAKKLLAKYGRLSNE